MAKQRWFSGCALMTVFFALGVIALGAFTRLMDAGLGCPDWPGCYGHMVPYALTALQPSDVPVITPQWNGYKAWAEMVHRYFAGALSFFSAVLIIMSFTKKWRTVPNGILSLVLLALIAYQIILGQWTVTLKLWPIIVTQHLMGGFFILTVLWLMALHNNGKVDLTDAKLQDGPLAVFAFIGLIILLMQIILGAWTSTNYAALSCTGFPFCTKETLFPFHWQAALSVTLPVGANYEGGVLTESVRQTIQMMHRLGAAVVTVYLFLFASFCLPRLKRAVALAKTLYIILALLCIQIALGAFNVMFQLPWPTALLHTLIASLLWLSLVTFIYKLFTVQYRPKP